jgi:hypothetical protein
MQDSLPDQTIRAHLDGSVTLISRNPICFQNMVTLKRISCSIPDSEVVYAKVYDAASGMTAMNFQREVRWVVENCLASSERKREVLEYISELGDSVEYK